LGKRKEEGFYLENFYLTWVGPGKKMKIPFFGENKEGGQFVASHQFQLWSKKRKKSEASSGALKGGGKKNRKDKTCSSSTLGEQTRREGHE